MMYKVYVTVYMNISNLSIDFPLYINCPNLNMANNAIDTYRNNLLDQIRNNKDTVFILNDSDIVRANCIVGVSFSIPKEVGSNQQTTSSVDKLYVVTNRTNDGVYTPSLFTDLDSAKQWILECTVDNLKGAYNCLLGKDDNDIIEWAKNKAADGTLDFEFIDTESYIGYTDGSCNHMQLFEYDMNDIIN